LDRVQVSPRYDTPGGWGKQVSPDARALYAIFLNSPGAVGYRNFCGAIKRSARVQFSGLPPGKPPFPKQAATAVARRTGTTEVPR